MPNPAKYKNKSKWMKDCIHQTTHVERKKKEQGIAQCLNIWRQKKMAHRVACNFVASNDLPKGFLNVIKSAENRFNTAFPYKFPSDVKWETMFEEDQNKLAKGEYAFISPDFKTVYVDIDKIQKDKVPYEEVIIHEMGHFLDRHLGGGSYFSHSLKIPDLKNEPHEAFAMMTDYIVNNGHSGGPAQTALYNAVCDKLGIKNRVEPGN
jgi:hypothetical protein